MLLTKTAKVKWNGNNRKHLESKGYYPYEHNKEIEVNVLDLPHCSRAKIEVLCDYCLEEGIETIIPKEYQTYLSQNKNSIIQKDCCKKCINKKVRESNLLTYKVDNIFQLDEVKQKIINTNLDKYGEKYYSQTEESKLKYKNICQEKYGCDNVFQNEVIKEKSKNTCLDKYGVENYAQTDEYIIKTINTNLNKYGTEWIMQNEEIKYKTEINNINKYGVKNVMFIDEVKNKLCQTNLNKYGSEYYLQTDEYKEKYKQTSLKNWGTEHPMQNLKIKQKAINTLYKNGTCQTSTQQLYIYNLLKNNNYNVELNYPLSRINMDVALFINDIKIDIEYDCYYWHKNQQKDRHRDEFSKSQGWKILRVKSGHLLPTLEQLKESIDKLINTDRTFIQIVLDDWDRKYNKDINNTIII